MLLSFFFEELIKIKQTKGQTGRQTDIQTDRQDDRITATIATTNDLLKYRLNFLLRLGRIPFIRPLVCLSVPQFSVFVSAYVNYGNEW